MKRLLSTFRNQNVLTYNDQNYSFKMSEETSWQRRYFRNCL